MNRIRPTFLLDRKRFLVAFLSVAVLACAALGQETSSFLARASDLPDDAYWNMSSDHGGNHTRDLNVPRPPGSGWTDRDSNGSSKNSDRLMFGITCRRGDRQLLTQSPRESAAGRSQHGTMLRQQLRPVL